MRRKRTAVRTKKRSVAVLGIRSAAIGIAVGIGLCALLAALVKSGVISQGGIGIAGSAAAAGMVFMSGMTYGMMAEGLGLVQMGLFNLVFFPMHYRNAYDLGKPFLVASVAELLYMVAAEACDHVIPYMKTVCESYAFDDQLRQLPVLLGGALLFALLTGLAQRCSVRRFERVDL